MSKQKTTRMGGFEYLVRAKGLEPSTSTLARLRSSQLSYARTAWHILTYSLSECKHYFWRFDIFFCKYSNHNESSVCWRARKSSSRCFNWISCFFSSFACRNWVTTLPNSNVPNTVQPAIAVYRNPDSFTRYASSKTL